EAGGSDWQRTLGPLPANLLPVELQGTTTLPAGISLLEPNDPLHLDDEMFPLEQPLPTRLTISNAKLRKQGFSENETMLASGTTPIFVQGRQGNGVINYLAFDPGSPLLSNWPGKYSIWRMVLLHSMTEQLLTFRFGRNTAFSAGPGQLLTRARILDMLIPNALPGICVLLALLLGGLLILRPVR